MSHTRPHRIHILLVRDDRNLGARPGLPRLSLNLHHAVVHLRNLQLEQATDQPRMAARYQHPRGLRRTLDLQDIDLHTLPEPIGVQRALLRRRQHRLHLPQIHQHGAALTPLHHPRDNVPVPVAELLIDDVALGLSNPLRHHLLRGLRGDPPEILRRHLDIQEFPLLHRRIEPPRLRQGHLQVRILHVLHHALAREHRRRAVVPVDVYVDLAGRPVVLLVGRHKRGFDDLAQSVERDILFPAYVAKRLYEIDLHSLSAS